MLNDIFFLHLSILYYEQFEIKLGGVIGLVIISILCIIIFLYTMINLICSIKFVTDSY